MADENDIKLARKNYDNLCALFDEKGWHYEKDDARLLIYGEAQGEDLPIPFRMFVDPDKMLVTLISVLPIVFPEDRRIDAAVATCIVNYRLSDGSFDYNIANGELLFRITASFHESVISARLFQYLFLCACFTVDDYNDRFLLLSKGEITVEGFIDK